MRQYLLTLALSPLFLDQLEPFVGVMGENVAAVTAWSKVDTCENRKKSPFFEPRPSRNALSFFCVKSLLRR